jgi:diguanylate cyclase (GGDEF)-like protein
MTRDDVNGAASRPARPPNRFLVSGAEADGPFSPDGRLERIAPFALVALLGIASLALPPGPRSWTDAGIAIALLVVTAVGIVLPWHRLPSGFMVLVPLAYTASVLMTLFATGSAISGIGVLVLVPLIWAALYHRFWESMVVVAAVVAFQVIVSITPLLSPDAVILRRALFWSLLGVLLSFATHRLRSINANQVRARDEDLRRTVALEHATEELTAILDPDEVIVAATRLAAEFASAPGTPGRRAQFCRIERDVVTFAAQFDSTGHQVTTSFALEDHPNLLAVYLSRQALSCPMDTTALGPSVRPIVERLGIVHSIYVPILRDGQVEGILSVSIRDVEPPVELFEQCKSFGHVVELALSNAWSHRDLGRQAVTDLMTGLPNRRGFEKFLAGRPGRRPFAVLAIDVDGLKQVNDTLGHDAGDALLVAVARAMQGALRRGDVLARLGGDEFAAYLIDATERDGRVVASRMLDSVAGIRATVQPGVSIGVAVGSAQGDVHASHVAADAAMYVAKRSGGGRYEVADLDTADALDAR